MGLSMLRRHPGYVVLASALLALAAGVTVTVFTIVNALWLKPLGVRDADRVVVLMADTAANAAGESWVFGELEGASGWEAFEAVAGQVVTTAEFSEFRRGVAIDQVGRELETAGVTSQYFRVLGQQIRGRDFTPADNRPGAAPVAIISYRLWQQAFGGRGQGVGATVAARPFPITIIGVAPPGFSGARRGEQLDVWIPARLSATVSASGMDNSYAPPVFVMGRLQPGRTLAETKSLFLQDASSDMDRRNRERAEFIPLPDVFGTHYTRTVVIREHRPGFIVASLAALVLLAGCATLMALVLVHYERRRRELAVKVALGITRSRLTVELAIELGLLALLGTTGAVAIATVSLRTLPSLTLPGGVDLQRLDLTLDWRVLAVALCVSLLTLVAGGSVPLRRFTRADLGTSLIAAGATSAASSYRLRQALLGLHAACTVVVLVAAGLFVRAVVVGHGDGPGIDTSRTAFVQTQVVSSFAVPGEDPSTRRARVAETTRQIADGIRSLPGVQAVALGPSPIGPDPAALLLAPKMVTTAGVSRELRIGLLSGEHTLLSTLGVRIVRGRGLDATDIGSRPRPGVITSSLAAALWPAEDPIGQVITVGSRPGSYVVVGVAADFVYGSLTQPSSGVLISVRETGLGIEPEFVVRAERPDLLLEPIRNLVMGLAPDAPRLTISTGHDVVNSDLGRQRLGAWFFSSFGLVALILGAGGVYGLVAYLAEARRRDFGVLLALGATTSDLIRRGVSAGLLPVAAGVVIGWGAAALVSRVFIAVLPGLSPLDPLTYLSVGAIMTACAFAAGLIGSLSLRALAPSDALRE
jgi:putative ABC transport system permease protein